MQRLNIAYLRFTISILHRLRYLHIALRRPALLRIVHNTETN